MQVHLSRLAPGRSDEFDEPRCISSSVSDVAKSKDNGTAFDAKPWNGNTSARTPVSRGNRRSSEQVITLLVLMPRARCVTLIMTLCAP